MKRLLLDGCCLSNPVYCGCCPQWKPLADRAWCGHYFIKSDQLLVNLKRARGIEGKYLLNKEMRNNHFTVKQVHFLDHTHKIAFNTNKKWGVAATSTFKNWSSCWEVSSSKRRLDPSLCTSTRLARWSKCLSNNLALPVCKCKLHLPELSLAVGNIHEVQVSIWLAHSKMLCIFWCEYFRQLRSLKVVDTTLGITQ